MSVSKPKQAFWMVVGYGLLIGPCLRRSWEPCVSTINPFNRTPRLISQWKWAWLNTIYGNREDGVSGEEALIWTVGESKYDANDRVGLRVYYRPKDWPPLRAWLWSAWRNSTNELSR